MIYSIRGATTVEVDTSGAIKLAALELFMEMFIANGLQHARIVSLIISTTPDITAELPATAVRESGFDIPLFSCLEPTVDGSMPLTVRYLLTADLPDGSLPVPVYLKGARGLRPDLTEG